MWYRPSTLVSVLAGVCALVCCIGVRAADPGALQTVRERTFDFYQRVEPRPIGTDVPVRIVDIDDASLAEHGQWPWPRDLLAEMTDVLAAAGAAVIAFDMIFPEPDRSSPLAALARLDLPPQLRLSLTDELARVPDHDARFAQALAAAPSVLGVALSPTEGTFEPAAGLAVIGPPPMSSIARAPGTTGSLPGLETAVRGRGGIHVSVLDDDAVVRRIPVLTAVGDALLPSLFAEALRVAQGEQSLILRTQPDPSRPGTGIPDAMGIGAFTLPLTETGAYRLLYGTLDPALTLPAAEVLAARDDPARLAGRLGGTIVLVGTSAPGLFDLRASPLGTLVPGVTMHAQAIAGILTGINLDRPDWALGLELTAMTGLGIVVLLAGLLARPTLAALLAGGLAIAIPATSWWAFSEHRLLVDATAPMLATLLTFGAVTVPRLVTTDQKQRFIRSAFSYYLAEPVLARLERDPSALALEGERRVITVMFMDVRGFTARSETMTPTDAVNLLNGLLDPLSEAVLAEEGTIDKFMGDGMMAFWNAPMEQPDHAERALRAAQAMVRVLGKANAARDEETPLAIGIGLHTGEAFVGNMGSKRRFAYSAIGDTVNLAARVEALTGTLGIPLLVTADTRSAIAQAEPCSPLLRCLEPAGEHRVKGRAQPVTVFGAAPGSSET